jgi:D-alanine-D-alanine ligase
MTKLRVGVLFGGQSGEHEVSLTSARAVMAALDPERYEAVPIGIAKDGRWLVGGDPLAALEAAADQHKLPTGVERTRRSPLPPEEAASPLSLIGARSISHASPGHLDVVFPVLHGPLGEDGTVQGLLELAGVPYVGCGVAASAVGMDKALAKAAFAAAGLALVPWALVRRAELERDPDAVCERLESSLGYPMFVKPANMGSSVGITKAKRRADLAAGLTEAARYDRRIVVEQGIDAREIEVSVLGNEEMLASLPGEVIPANEWYDYADKYLDGRTQYGIPADLTPEKTGEVQQLAIAAFQAIGGEGLARVDFLLDRATDICYINEVNTMPGFTPISMYSKLWAATGLSYPALLDKLIQLALERRNQLI